MDGWMNKRKIESVQRSAKDQAFSQRGIRMLPGTREKDVVSDGQYFEWFIYNHFLKIKVDFIESIGGF